MIYCEWPEIVNTRFFDFAESFDDNATSTEYASGRKAVILKNTRFPRKIACSLTLDVKSGEYKAFWSWFRYVLGGVAGVFSSKVFNEKNDNVNHYYRFSKTPTNSTGQLLRTLKIELEEVY